jgi:hypothetical protein
MGITDSRINRGFSSRTRTAAPVQTEENGWQKYLSERERTEYSNAHKHLRSNEKIIYTGAGIFWGCNLLLGATVATGLAGMAVGLGMVMYGLGRQTINSHRARSLEKGAMHREGDIEVMRDHGVTPKGPQA